MTRKIRYKPVSKELENIAKPSTNQSTRMSIGLDQAVGEYYFIDANELHPFQNQARKSFKPEEIKKLADSIKDYGVRQPLTVIKNQEGKYEVISGERRLRAAKQVGLERLPCIILKENKDANAIALIENIHRKDLHPIELGIVYKKLLEEHVFENQDKLAQAISVTKSTISEYIKLSKIPEDIRLRIIEQNIISRDKLRQILKAYVENDITKMRNIVGLEGRKHKNFSVIRVLSSEGELKLQDSGISKLSPSVRIELKNKLQDIIKSIELM